MFESKPTDEDPLSITSVTRSREALTKRAGSVVVTDGSGSFYASRQMFQMLHDFGRYESIVASSASTADAKKMLISRTGRYSGLLDVLTFHEDAEPTAAFAGADSWLAISPDETSLAAQVDAAVAAGVRRIFLLLSAAAENGAALEEKLAASDVKYTVMRTGPLVAGPGGEGLKLGELDMPVCEDVPRDDVFRFAVEALTLSEADGRVFSLCPAPGVTSTLKEMRLCGYDRREEIQLLLQGTVREPEAAAEPSAAESAEAAEMVMRSEAEVAAERAEELEKLLARARQRGVETQERMVFEEAEKAARRKEQEKYYSKPDGDDDGPTDTPDEISDAPPAPK